MALDDCYVVHNLGEQAYELCLERMRAFTDARNQCSQDQLWLVQHPSVYTLGRRGAGCDISKIVSSSRVVSSDRGGLITWHGPGQIVLYWLADLKRLNMGVRALVSYLEQSVISLLASHGIESGARRDAPGVYLADGAKIASLGLRVRRGCSYHGLALNVCNDLAAFELIEPCGLAGIRMTSLKTLGLELSPLSAGQRLVDYLLAQVYTQSS